MDGCREPRVRRCRSAAPAAASIRRLHVAHGLGRGRHSFLHRCIGATVADNVLESYAGYAHVVPRTLASIGVHLPTERYSAFVTLAAALSASVLALFVYFASAPLLRSPRATGHPCVGDALLAGPAVRDHRIDHQHPMGDAGRCASWPCSCRSSARWRSRHGCRSWCSPRSRARCAFCSCRSRFGTPSVASRDGVPWFA